MGDFSRRLFALRPGDTIEAKGPFGKWVYAGDAHAVLISGGTGIAPLRAMARYKLDARVSGRMTILYSCKTAADMLYRDELEGFRRAGIKVYATLTRPADEPSSRWTGPTGRIDVAAIRREVPDFTEATFYLCGPAALVKELSSGLAAAGVPPERLLGEIWADYRDLSF